MQAVSAVAAIGRNEQCPCGSGRKVKRCCGVESGPGEAALAQAFLAEHARAAASVLLDLEDGELSMLINEVSDLPAYDLALLVPLPRLVTPELDRLCRAVAADDWDDVEELLPPALERFDTPVVRAELARAILVLREARRLDDELAAAALIDLARTGGELVRESLLESVAVAVGASATPGGITVVSESSPLPRGTTHPAAIPAV